MTPLSAKALFAPTLKAINSNNGNTIMSHLLLTRAGFIRQSGLGLFNTLPLGLRTLGKLEKIIDEEMAKIGGQKVSLTSLISADLWKKTGRWAEMGDEMMRMQDRKKVDYALAPTAEEEITSLVAAEVFSHRQLPVKLYQIGRKYRDEIRPRFGLMRSREFIMKDMYTFDSTKDDAIKTYADVCGAYHNIFKRIGVNVVQVEADTGKIGGSLSHEFQLLSDVGEDEVLACQCGKYAANKELAVGAIPGASQEKLSRSGVLDMLHASMSEKNSRIRVEAVWDATKKHGALVLLPKGRETNTIRLQQIVGSDPQVVHLNHFLGSLHTLDEFKVCLDDSLGSLDKDSQFSAQAKSDGLSAMSSFLRTRCTAIHLNLPDNWEEPIQKLLTKFVGSVEAGDIPCDHFRFAKEGDACARCGGAHSTEQHLLKTHRGIELGHAFYLGTKYSAAMDALIQTPAGKKEPMVMGCFGLGLGRIMAGVVEVSHDKNGIIWPKSLAPYRLCVIADKSPQLVEKAKLLCQEIGKHQTLGLDGEVVIDDREESVGFKLKDAQLIGYPWIVVVGKSFLGTEKAEFYIRGVEGMKLLGQDELIEAMQRDQ